jgi:hypothetical protein
MLLSLSTLLTPFPKSAITIATSESLAYQQLYYTYRGTRVTEKATNKVPMSFTDGKHRDNGRSTIKIARKEKAKRTKSTAEREAEAKEKKA